jgi:hypothetical protein
MFKELGTPLLVYEKRPRVYDQHKMKYISLNRQQQPQQFAPFLID